MKPVFGVVCGHCKKEQHFIPQTEYRPTCPAGWFYTWAGSEGVGYACSLEHAVQVAQVRKHYNICDLNAHVVGNVSKAGKYYPR